MNNQNINRNTLFIQKKFQTRSILIVISIIALAGLLSGLILYFILSSELKSELQVAHTQIQNAWDLLGPSILFGNAFTVIVAAIVAAIAVLYQSHKIAGPMFRLQKICEEVAEGNLNPVTKLRKADQLTALAMSFDNMVSALRLRQDKASNKIGAVVDQLDQLIDTETDQQKKSSLESIRKKLSDV